MVLFMVVLLEVDVTFERLLKPGAFVVRST